MNWGHSAVWDPHLREVRFIGKSHAQSSRIYWIIYDEASNSWCADPTGAASNCREVHPDLTVTPATGHGYDFNAIDPATGDHYYRPYGIDPMPLYRWDASSRTWHQDYTMRFDMDIAETMSWFPALGLVVTDQKGCHYSRDKGASWQSCSGPSLSGVIGYHSWSEYQPNSDVMLFGGGNNGPSVVFSLDRDGTYRRVGNAPYGISNSHGAGRIVADPVTGEFLAIDQNSAGGDWRVYDPATDRWSSSQPRTPSSGCLSAPCDGFPYMTEASATDVLAVPIDTYGVTMWLAPDDTGQADQVWLYRHAASEIPTDPPGPPPNLQIADPAGGGS